MKKLMKYFFIFTLVPTLFLTSCKEENDVYTPEPGPDLSENFETLKDYMVANDLDLPDVLTGWIVGAPADLASVDAFVAGYDIIDIRKPEHYAAGHIQGAVNSSLENILNTAANTTKPILVACYTGQTASHAVVALRLSGYTDAKVLKWGMSGWNSTLSANWENNSGATNGAVGEGHANWSTTPAIADNQIYSYPGFNTTATSGAAILEERVQAMINAGFKGVSADNVLTTPANYFINNYWALSDVEHYGHIAGAHRIQPLSLENNEIANLDPDATICTYCWTGQTSSMITAYLNVIGYDAVSLMFGSNKMIYPSLESHKFVTPTVDLPLVTSTAANVFSTLSDYLVANDLDLPDILNGWITGAPAEADLATFLSTYDIIDIRAADAYNAGHIEGAINSTLGNIVSDAAGTTKPILVACYSGQTAAHAVVALRLSGYTDAKVLKFGMSGWNSTLSGSWESNSGAANGAVAEGHSNWVTSAVETNQTFGYPSIMSTYTDGANILQERVTAMTTNGFQGVNATVVLTSPSNYFINNYWAQADVDKYGHIAGAYRIQPLSLENGEMANLDSGAQICTYCWTGQTSSMITAYLNVLGYDAVSLKFGSNKMIYPSLESHKFATPTTDLPLVN